MAAEYPTTIVTAYFQLSSSKASHHIYLEWMQNMLSIETPMVIFTDAGCREQIRQKRPAHLPTAIIVTEFGEFHTHKYEQTFAEHFLQYDHETAIGHNPKLSQIWNEKPHFLKRATEADPFHSKYFLWVDIGCVRLPELAPKLSQFPSTARLDASIGNNGKDKILLLYVYSFSDAEWGLLGEIDIANIPSFQYTNRLGGTIFGGTKRAVEKWWEEYYTTLDDFIRIGRFIGKDQSIINTVFLRRPDLVQLVAQTLGNLGGKGGDLVSDWFYLLDFLADVSFGQTNDSFGNASTAT